MILAALYLKEPITSKKVMGIFMGAVGALILILSADAAHTGENAGGMTGNILCLMAELCFATYCVVFKDLIGRYSPVTLMKWMFTYAAICCIPFSYNGLASINFTTLPTAVYADLAFIVFGATFLSYLLVPIGQHRASPDARHDVLLFATHRRIDARRTVGNGPVHADQGSGDPAGFRGSLPGQPQ